MRYSQNKTSLLSSCVSWGRIDLYPGHRSMAHTQSGATESGAHLHLAFNPSEVTQRSQTCNLKGLCNYQFVAGKPLLLSFITYIGFAFIETHCAYDTILVKRRRFCGAGVLGFVDQGKEKQSFCVLEGLFYGYTQFQRLIDS